MKTKILLPVSLVSLLSVFSCKEGEQKEPIVDVEKEALQYYDPKDSNVVKAYVEDKSTITPLDIDPFDKVYATKSKILYSRSADDRLAVIYGFKSDVKEPGVVLVQKNTEKPVKLPQVASDAPDQLKFSDGKVTFIREGVGDFVYLADDASSAIPKIK